LKHFDEVLTTQGFAIMNPKTDNLPTRKLIEQSLSRRSFVPIVRSNACIDTKGKSSEVDRIAWCLDRRDCKTKRWPPASSV